MATPDPGKARATPRPRVLLIGRVQEVLDRITATLAAEGLVAKGTTDMANAATRFDARDFDLIALGGGVSASLRERLKQTCTDRHPTVRIIDAFAPVAVQQILAAARNVNPNELASRFDVVASERAYRLRLELTKECDLKIQLYHARDRLESEPLTEQRAPAGPFELDLPSPRLTPGLNILLVTLDGREHHTHRIERE